MQRIDKWLQTTFGIGLLTEEEIDYVDGQSLIKIKPESYFYFYIQIMKEQLETCGDLTKDQMLRIRYV